MSPEPARVVPFAAVPNRRRPPEARVPYPLARRRVASLREPPASLARLVSGHA